MAREQDPFWCCGVEEDRFGDGPADEGLVNRDGFGFEHYGSCFPERCCTPTHSPSECVGVQMTEDLYAETSDDGGDHS